MCFLKGLEEVYGTLKTQILLTQPLPNFNKILSLILQQKRQLSYNVIADIKFLKIIKKQIQINSVGQYHFKNSSKENCTSRYRTSHVSRSR